MRGAMTAALLCLFCASKSHLSIKQTPDAQLAPPVDDAAIGDVVFRRNSICL
jgi:hypothetical protein